MFFFKPYLKSFYKRFDQIFDIQSVSFCQETQDVAFFGRSAIPVVIGLAALTTTS